MNGKSWTNQESYCLKSIEKLHEERKVMQFLMKLQSDYEFIRANILN